MIVIVNGDRKQVAEGATVKDLIALLGLSPDRIAVEVNRKIVKKGQWDSTELREGDKVEVVHFVGGGQGEDCLIIAGRRFRSRLILGTGKYPSYEVMVKALEASGAEMVTVAVRRVNLTDQSKESLLDYIDTSKYHILPNTAGCYSAQEAIRTAMLARQVLDNNWIKLEVIGDERTLFPDNEGLLEATRALVREGFIVLPYLNDDLIVARKLIDAGAAAVMPLAAPIGSGLGIQNYTNLRILREQITEVPLIVDAGVGTASDATIAMEMGVDGVLMNTAVACARDPVAMARAMKLGVEAGRLAYLAGRIPKKLYASASSPLDGISR
jgi:thiazole synthase